MAGPVPMNESSGPAPFQPPEDWIPVDKRRFGLDRRTIGPGLLVAVIALVMATVPTAIDQSVSYDDPIKPGEVIALTGGVTVSPPAGWNVESGVREGSPLAGGRYPQEAKLTDADTVVAIQSAPFTGTSAQLFQQITGFEKAISPTGPTVSEGTSTVTTRDGHQGVVGGYAGAGTDGVLAAVSANGVGVQVVAVTPKTADPQTNTDLAEIIQSMTITGDKS